MRKQTLSFQHQACATPLSNAQPTPIAQSTRRSAITIPTVAAGPPTVRLPAPHLRGQVELATFSDVEE